MVISIHAPTRGATEVSGDYDSKFVISIHAPTRGATWRFLKEEPHQTDFNSRPYARGDPLLQRSSHCENSNFNSRPYARGDSVHCMIRTSIQIFQFTPLREGRLSPLHDKDINPDISIHAPTRGATEKIGKPIPENIISIHAPTRGATLGRAICKKAHSFQFTPLREGRQGSDSFSDGSAYFNSRPYARGDLGWLDDLQGRSFQFTPLREGRPAGNGGGVGER